MKLLNEIRSCTHCVDHLPLGPNPVVHFSLKSRIIIVGQAPGIKVHETSTPWNDASGNRLREWLGVSKEEFYDTDVFGIVPMGFCYPGKGKSGDLPPRPECAKLWMRKILNSLRHIELMVLIGQYSQNYFLKDSKKENLTETVRNWKRYLPEYFVLPHPSPRNNIWLKKNPWFERKTIPALRKVISEIY
ncbi:MAG: uracil-DNA glycosylase family protein [Bdellovibrionota bacterium]